MLYQHTILPGIQWPMLVHAFPFSTVEGFERRVSSCLRHWLGLPKSLSSIAIVLYGSQNKWTLPIHSLTEEFMVARAREVLQYRESKDPRVSQTGIEVRTESGRKWRAQEAVDRAESRLGHRELVGSVAMPCRTGYQPDKPLQGKAKKRLDLAQHKGWRTGFKEQRLSWWVELRQQNTWAR